MNKREFIEKLKSKLKAYKQEDVEDAINYYSDLIDDKVENESISEEDAIASLGDIDKIAKKISVEMIANDKENKNGGAKSLLIVLGCLFASPILLPLTICILVLIIVFFALWISLSIGFAGGAIGCLAGCIAIFFQYSTPFSILFGLGICLIAFVILATLAILSSYGGWKLSSSIAKSLARLMTKKGNK